MHAQHVSAIYGSLDDRRLFAEGSTIHGHCVTREPAVRKVPKLSYRQLRRKVGWGNALEVEVTDYGLADQIAIVIDSDDLSCLNCPLLRKREAESVEVRREEPSLLV